MGRAVVVLLVQTLLVPIDCITFGIVLFNFSVVGVLAMFMRNGISRTLDITLYRKDLSLLEDIARS